MKKKYLMHRFSKTLAVVILSAAMLLSGCTSANQVSDTTSTGTEAQAQQSQSSAQGGSSNNYSASSGL